MTPDPICPARHGRHRCERWDLPAAHTDGVHQAGRVTWPANRAEGPRRRLRAVPDRPRARPTPGEDPEARLVRELDAGGG